MRSSFWLFQMDQVGTVVVNSEVVSAGSTLRLHFAIQFVSIALHTVLQFYRIQQGVKILSC